MVTESVEQTQKHRSSVGQRKVSLWGYYFYCELLKVFRDPAVLIFGIGFPSMFFLMFSGAYSGKYAASFLAQYAAYGVFVVAFQTFTIEISMERNLGWSRLLRTTPLSATLYLVSKVAVVMLIALVSLLCLYTIAFFVGHVQMPLSSWITLLISMLLCMVPFILLGMALGFSGTSNFVQIFSTLVTLFLSLTSGLFVPLQYLPSFVRFIAPYLPTYHLGQVAWNAVGSTWSRDSYPVWFHLLVLTGFSVVFAVLAIWAYVRDENKSYA